MNTKKKNDGHVGGQKFIFSKEGDNTGTLGSNTDLHFTVLCFNNALGTPILCAVILKSKKTVSEIPLAWQFGIDITKNLQGDPNGNQVQFFLDNSGPDGAMCGGPECTYNGKTIPCFVGTSPNASITSHLLAEMLKHIDKFAQFDRSDGQKPFLLLDGHQSRFDIPFLDYIHTAEHEWVCCLGVPYGTHLWQVADSSQLNGNFKVALTKKKRQFFEIKRALNKNFEQQDIIPLINHSFKQSYGNEAGARKAMLERGWSPLNYALLEHEQLKKSKVKYGADLQSNLLSINNTNTNTLDLSTINMREGSLLATASDLLLQERSKQQGYQDKMNKRKREIASKKSSLEKLQVIGRLTSGTMAAGGLYYLSSDVRDIIKTNCEKKEKDKQAVVRRVNNRHNSSVEEYHVVRNKIILDPTIKLTTKEMKVGLKFHTRKSDSPIKSKVNDLRIQYDKRKHRITTEAAPTMKYVEDDDYVDDNDEDVAEKENIEDIVNVQINTMDGVDESYDL